MSQTNPKLGELLRSLSGALCNVIGTAQSIRVIGEALPTTPHDDEDIICPELVFPALADGVNVHANSALSLVEQIETLLQEPGGRANSNSK
jgi:hypothetical protein